MFGGLPRAAGWRAGPAPPSMGDLLLGPGSWQPCQAIAGMNPGVPGRAHGVGILPALSLGISWQAVTWPGA